MPKGKYIRKSTPIVDRFWAKVVQNDDGCWGWNSYTNGVGYGLIHVRRRLEGYRKNIYAHRLSWEIHNGPIPNGLHVLHRCDNPQCTRPDHLFLGTNLDNIADCTTKGRSKTPKKAKHGEDNPSSKLTANAVRSIRASNELGTVLATRFNVTKSAISCIKNGKTWRSILS